MKMGEELAVMKSKIPNFNIRAEALNLKIIINELQAKIDKLPKSKPTREKSVCNYLHTKLTSKISSISLTSCAHVLSKSEIKKKLNELKNIDLQFIKLPKNTASIKTDLQIIKKQVLENTQHFDAFTQKELRGLLKSEARVSEKSLEDLNQEILILTARVRGFSRKGNYTRNELLLIKEKGIACYLKSLNFLVPEAKQADLEAQISLLPDLLEMKKKYNMLRLTGGSGFKFSPSCACCATNSAALQSSRLELQRLADVLKNEA